jgi:hypothetical protein
LIRTRGIVALAVAALLMLGALPLAPAALALGHAESVGAGADIEPEPWTPSPDVVLHILPPPDDSSMLRISNDASTWVEMPYAAVVPWSLIDPATGGTDEDGLKTVTVWYGNGGEDWRWSSTPTVTLDRTAPTAEDVTGVTIDGRMWRGTVDGLSGDALADVAATRYSLDGGATWEPWAIGNVVDVWNATGAPAWAAGDLSIDVQVRDAAGNVSDPITTTATINAPSFGYPTYAWNLPGVTIETPNPAITGETFTFRINYPDGYTLPSNAWCQWIVTWGDDESVQGTANPTWGELFIERSKANGACEEWTFTLPWREARQFAWSLQVGTKNANTEPMELLTPIIEIPSVVFRALDGPHDERFASSSIPFAYVLPETTVSQFGDPVTYRLHTVGTSVVPQSGMWWTSPLDCYLNPAWSQNGGNTFTYKPKCDGPWVTGWTGVMHKGYMRSQYDPMVDGKAPKVKAPAIRLGTGALGTSVPGSVRWSAKDPGSGVQRYEVQIRRNGGAWRAVDLPSRLTTSVSRTFAIGDSYRFRVRARDKVGNWSDWAYGPTTTPTLRQQTNAAVTWGGTWQTVTDPAFSGGSARSTTAGGSAVRFIATAQSIAWVSRSGPGRGLAQVWVDGVLAATVDLGAESLSGKRVVFARSWAASGRHVVRIVSLGTTGRPLVEVDAFISTP